MSTESDAIEGVGEAVRKENSGDGVASGEWRCLLLLIAICHI